MHFIPLKKMQCIHSELIITSFKNPDRQKERLLTTSLLQLSRQSSQLVHARSWVDSRSHTYMYSRISLLVFQACMCPHFFIYLTVHFVSKLPFFLQFATLAFLTTMGHFEKVAHHPTLNFSFQ